MPHRPRSVLVAERVPYLRHRPTTRSEHVSCGPFRWLKVLVAASCAYVLDADIRDVAHGAEYIRRFRLGDVRVASLTSFLVLPERIFKRRDAGDKGAQEGDDFVVLAHPSPLPRRASSAISCARAPTAAPPHSSSFSPSSSGSSSAISSSAFSARSARAFQSVAASFAILR